MVFPLYHATFYTNPGYVFADEIRDHLMKIYGK